MFPRLRGLGTEIEGTGLTVRVRITRVADAPPVRLVDPDDPMEAAAIREVDLQKTFKYGAKALAGKLEIDTARAKALRWELGVEDDPMCRHDFVFEKTRLMRYSDRALERMRAAIAAGADLNAVRARYRAAQET